MRKILLPVILICAFAGGVTAQQNAMFTNYMFNSLVYNPAYAGSSDAISVTLLHRHQWVGFDGAPMTQTLSAHSPLKNEHIALGGSLMYDRIGINKTITLSGDYAYRFPIGKKGKLSLGIQASASNWRANANDLTFKDGIGNDVSYNGNEANQFLFNFGVGAYYYTDRFYIGAAVPNLLENSMSSGNITSAASQYRHLFLAAGAVFKLSHTIDFKPSVLWKNVGMFSSKLDINNLNYSVGSPNEVDLDLSFLFNKTLWVGAAFRTALESSSSFDSVDFWASYVLQNGLRLGVGYDFTLTDINRATKASYELMVGYDFNTKKTKVRTPRYF